MTGPPEEPGLFREEALRRHLDPGAVGDVLRLTPGWARASFWLLAAFGATVAAFLAFVRIDELASGPAIVRVDPSGDVRVEIYLRDRDATRLRAGLPVVLRRDASPGQTVSLAVTRVGEVVLSPEEAREALGLASGDAAIADGRVVVEAAWPRAAPASPLRDRERGRADVVTGKERLGRILFPGWDGGAR